MSARRLRVVEGDSGERPPDLPPLEHYEIVLRGAGRSERHVTDSIATLKRLERRANRPIENVSALDVSRFCAAENLSASSRATYFRQVNSFFKWWASQGGVWTTEILPRPKDPVHEPRPVSNEELIRLLDETRMHKRTRVMILLAAFAGLRAHEIAKFRGEDIDLGRNCLYVTGKGRKRAQIPLHSLIREAAGEMPSRGWWFPSNSTRPGQHVHRRGVSDVIVDAMQRADIHGSAHALRHWYATALLESGTDIRVVQSLMRHSSLATTAKYLGITDQRRADAVERLSGVLGEPPDGGS